ncbi:hypothetical protein L3X38_011652 [Prunus dulcis]|uniref:SWIM-type domain-containing protein n=1 Tax=Prunus dulcis TaxID=3755 RepID=A0AAD4ZFM1_PRUDU|nr:hypothetical protein L3X38_011652 [Prunus dulcis]
MKKNFEFKLKRSNKERFEVGCVDDGCMWKLRASKASSYLIGQCIKSKYEGVSRVHRPHDIVEDMRKDMGVSISYVKAWRAREHALELVRGLAKESYMRLPSYCAMLEAKNLGFHSVIRPVIALDETFLKGKYLGTLFVATCKDGNNQIYPLAFGVGDSENDTSWNWFLTKLRGAIGHIDDLVFISDRHESIWKAISTIFPDAHHGACIFHISQNLKNHFKHERAHSLYFRAAKAYRIHEFDHMVQIFNVVPYVGNYLHAAGYEKWARAYFNGKRYNLMTTNIAECLNSITRDARKMPITNFMEYLRMNILQNWFHKRQTEAAKMDSHLTEWADKLVRENNQKRLSLQVSSIEAYSFHVYDGSCVEVVNLEGKCCTCREFDLDQLPCAHACAVCRHRQISCYPMCSKYYTTNSLVIAYAEPIWLVGNQTDWVVPNDVRDRIVLSPITRRRHGRRKEKRIPSRGEEPSTRKCSQCGSTGHYRQTCKNPIALHPTS